MCGIFGYWAFATNNEPGPEVLTRGIHGLAHRGPEGVRFATAGNFSAAHSALTFFRAGRSNQPFHSPCGKYVVLFNGEIYNAR